MGQYLVSIHLVLFLGQTVGLHCCPLNKSEPFHFREVFSKSVTLKPNFIQKSLMNCQQFKYKYIVNEFL